MSQPRVYGGLTAAQRRQARRDRLVATGLDVFGTTGFASSSIERLCSKASVSTRYFYEEFPSREALLQAVFDEVLQAASQAGLRSMQQPGLSPLEQVESGVRTYVLIITSDPRRTRVVHNEVRTVVSMAPRRLEAAGQVAELFRRTVGAPVDLDAGPFVPGLVLLGAANEVLSGWAAQAEPRSPVAPLAQGLARFARDALEPFVTPDAQAPTRGGRAGSG